MAHIIYQGKIYKQNSTQPITNAGSKDQSTEYFFNTHLDSREEIGNHWKDYVCGDCLDVSISGTIVDNECAIDLVGNIPPTPVPTASATPTPSPSPYPTATPTEGGSTPTPPL